MLEVSASTIAWLSVVIVQALLHYFVLGARRERMHQEKEALLEESLSFSIGENFIDSDLDSISIPGTPTAAPTLSSISYISSDRQDRDFITISRMIPSTSTKHQALAKLNVTEQARNASFYLTQTGSEMLKVCEKIIRF